MLHIVANHTKMLLKGLVTLVWSPPTTHSLSALHQILCSVDFSQEMCCKHMAKGKRFEKWECFLYWQVTCFESLYMRCLLSDLIFIVCAA